MPANKTTPPPANAARFPTPELVVAETGKHIPEQQAYLHLVRTGQELTQQLAEMLSAHGISGKQYNVLRAARRAGERGATVSDIHDQMAERGADVTRLVDRLVRQGLVQRKEDEDDRRIVRTVLTVEGRALLGKLDEPLIALHKAQLGHLSEDELALLIALLVKVQAGPLREAG